VSPKTKKRSESGPLVPPTLVTTIASLAFAATIESPRCTMTRESGWLCNDPTVANTRTGVPSAFRLFANTLPSADTRTLVSGLENTASAPSTGSPL
jgi:hypothetical protein